MKNNEELEQEFEKLVRKAEEDSKKRQKKDDFGLLIIEMVLQLSGVIIIVHEFNWFVGLGLFLWFTGNNLQVFRQIKNK